MTVSCVTLTVAQPWSRSSVSFGERAGRFSLAENERWDRRAAEADDVLNGTTWLELTYDYLGAAENLGEHAARSGLSRRKTATRRPCATTSGPGPSVDRRSHDAGGKRVGP